MLHRPRSGGSPTSPEASIRTHVPTPQSMALTTEQVVERLLATASGQIVACNIVAGIQHGLVDAAWAAGVLAWMGELGSHAKYADAAEFRRALDDLRMHRPPARLPADPPDVRLGGTDTPGPFEVEVSWVQPAWRLGELMSPEDHERFAREGLVLPSSSSDALSTAMVNEWQSRSAPTRMARVKPTVTLGRPHDVVWFTRRSVFRDALDAVSPTLRGHRAREVLGLVHYREGAMLAAMHFQPPTLSACLSARPTFADAGRHRRFKTWPDDQAARKERGWGRTVDLHALHAAIASVDGCPERIAKSIPGHSLANGATFEFELLGAVQASADQGDVADAAFATRLSNGRTVAELGTDLNTLIRGHEA